MSKASLPTQRKMNNLVMNDNVANACLQLPEQYRQQ